MTGIGGIFHQGRGPTFCSRAYLKREEVSWGEACLLCTRGRLIVQENVRNQEVLHHRGERKSTQVGLEGRKGGGSLRHIPIENGKKGREISAQPNLENVEENQCANRKERVPPDFLSLGRVDYYARKKGVRQQKRRGGRNIPLRPEKRNLSLS